MIIRMHVVLPAPFGPITPYNAAAGHRERDAVNGFRRSERFPHVAQDERWLHVFLNNPHPMPAGLYHAEWALAGCV